MNKIAKILFLITACIFPIFIGLLHTITHFSQLVTPEINQFLQKEFVILGESQSLWNTWGIVSFMMGASFIIIGLLNISTIKKLSKTDFLPVLSLIAMILYQGCVTYVGYEFEQSIQFYGGIFGGTLLVISLILTIRLNTSTLEGLKYGT